MRKLFEDICYDAGSNLRTVVQRFSTLTSHPKGLGPVSDWNQLSACHFHIFFLPCTLSLKAGANEKTLLWKHLESILLTMLHG